MEEIIIKVVSEYANKYSNKIPQVALLASKYPFEYLFVYSIWRENDCDIDSTEKQLQNIVTKGY